MEERNKREKFLEFEDLMSELFIKMLGNDSIKRNVKKEFKDRQFEIDILIGENRSSKSQLTVVEVKYYRAFSEPSVSVLKRAVNLLRQNMLAVGASKGILIAPFDWYKYRLKLDLDLDLYLDLDPNIELWNLQYILEMANPYPELLEKIKIFLELENVPSDVQALHLIQNAIPRGEELVRELGKIQPGRNDAPKFEVWCIEALKYLFKDYLIGWHDQSKTIDGLHRRDLVCRVISGNRTEVWELISNTLRSRYVIFEFKNYTDKITQHEIITTERYLYPTALRNCAVIISKKGTSENADRVIEGAMREHGRLIISLDCEDMEKMLLGKDQGDDPNVYLFEKVDEFLIGLGR